MYFFFFVLESLFQLGDILRRNCYKINLGYREYDLDGIIWESGLSNKIQNSDEGVSREKLEIKSKLREIKRME